MKNFGRKIPSHLPSHSRRGALLMLVLWLILVLAVMAYSLTYELRLGLNMTGMSVRKEKARALARAGLAKGVLDLRNDRLMSIASATQPGNLDTLQEVWALDDDKTEVKRGEGTYSVRIADEESKFDINALQFPRLPLLQELIKESGHYHDADARDISTAVLDFIDPDLTTTGGVRGDEVEVLTQWGLDKYAKDLPQGWTFRPKNDFLQNLDELAGVPGITLKMLHGDPAKEPTEPLARVDFLRSETGGFDPSVSLDDCLSIGTSGQLNINTASPAVLKILLTAVSPNDSSVDTVVSQIVKARKTKLAPQNKVTGFTDLAQVAQAGIPAEIIQRAAAMYPLSVYSLTFTISSRGDYQGVHHTMIATVRATAENFPIDPEKASTLGSRDSSADGGVRNQTGSKIDPAVRVLRFQEL